MGNLGRHTKGDRKGGARQKAKAEARDAAEQQRAAELPRRRVPVTPQARGPAAAGATPGTDEAAAARERRTREELGVLLEAAQYDAGPFRALKAAALKDRRKKVHALEESVAWWKAEALRAREANAELKAKMEPLQTRIEELQEQGARPVNDYKKVRKGPAEGSRGGGWVWPLWIVQLILEQLVNGTPPTAIPKNIRAQARLSTYGSKDIDVPCDEYCRSMRAVLRIVTETLAAYTLGKSKAWAQLFTDGIPPPKSRNKFDQSLALRQSASRREARASALPKGEPVETVSGCPHQAVTNQRLPPAFGSVR
mmetsp:Transcript_9019/g.15350  ORF Transcript_9019/g.15350 Transcript_9019/m.15350 type:complete len:310 (+) Transcript_9019:2116-3045(+)